jgi:hypothetical protein
MSWFAQIGTDNVVQQVLYVADTYTAAWVEQTYGGVWIEAFEDASQRRNFPSKGYTFDQQQDAFIPPKPYSKWVLNGRTYRWEAPVQYPNDGGFYVWDDSDGIWVLRTGA